MNTVLSRPLNLFLSFLLLLGACKKDDLIKPRPTPGDGGGNPGPAQKAMVRFTTNILLTGEPYHSTNLQAVVTITDSNQVEVLKERTLQLNLDSVIQTQAIQLPVGRYFLKSFRLEYGNVASLNDS